MAKVKTKSNYLIRINQNDRLMLERIKKATNIPFSKILRYLLNLYYKEEKISSGETEIQKYKFYHHDENKILRIKLTSEEYEHLQELCAINGFKSATKQAKFLILNTINKEKFFSNNEIESFIKLRSEIAKDSRNLYQLLKALRSKQEIKINSEALLNIFNNIDSNNNKLLESFGKILEKNQERV